MENLDGLAPKGKDKRPYKTVLKLTLLPQEKSTKTSKTIAAAMSPVVNEDFFISTKYIENKVLRYLVITFYLILYIFTDVLIYLEYLFLITITKENMMLWGMLCFI